MQDNFIHSEEYIFTTEAHPLHIAAVQAGGFDMLHKNLKSSSTAVTKVHTVQSAELSSAAVTGKTVTSVTASNGTISTVYTSDNVCGPVAVTPVQYYTNSSSSTSGSAARGDSVVQDVAVVAVPRDPRYAATCARRDALYMVVAHLLLVSAYSE
eukprot:14911-Heterococcus_DN1.PRE.2